MRQPQGHPFYCDQRRDERGIAEELEFARRVARQREIGSGDDHAGTVIAPHRIKRNADLLNHSMTARPLVCLCQNSQSAVTDLHANFGMKEIAVRL